MGKPQGQTRLIYKHLIIPKQITAIHLLHHIANVISNAVGDDDIGLLFELREVVHHSGMKELRLLNAGSYTTTSMPLAGNCFIFLSKG